MRHQTGPTRTEQVNIVSIASHNPVLGRFRLAEKYLGQQLRTHRSIARLNLALWHSCIRLYNDVKILCLLTVSFLTVVLFMLFSHFQRFVYSCTMNL